MVAYLPDEVRSEINRPVTWVDHNSTGTFALQEASKLGYRTVYLIGLEGSYEEKIPQASELEGEGRNRLRETVPLLDRDVLFEIKSKPEFNPNYFSDSYQRVGDIYSKPMGHVHREKLQGAVNSLVSQGVRVFNLSPISLVEAEEQSLKEFFNNSQRSRLDGRKDSVSRPAGRKFISSVLPHNLKNLLRIKAPKAYRGLRLIKNRLINLP